MFVCMRQEDKGPSVFELCRVLVEGKYREYNSDYQIFPGNKLKKIKLMSLLLSFYMGNVAHADALDDWKMRTELALESENGKKPTYSIETVQPLYRSTRRQHTVFTQIKAADADRFSERRNIFNVGLGYRHILGENSAIAGVQTFYDFESKYNMNHWGVGGDLRWNVFDIYANQYYGAGDFTRTNDGASEKSLNGQDVGLAIQLPFMPWAKAHVSYYRWNKERTAEILTGNKLSVEGALSLRWTLELGRNTDNVADNDNFMMLRYRWAGFVREHQNAGNNFWSSSAFEMRDMSDQTLERIRRFGTINVDRIEP